MNPKPDKFHKKTISNIFRRPSSLGVALGVVLMAFSFTPSLIPRLWSYQTAISTLSALCGYALGAAINALWRYLELPSIPRKYRRGLVLAILGVSGVILCYFAYRMLAWQNALRQWVEMVPVESVYPIRVILMTIAVAALAILFCRFLWWVGSVIVRFFAKYIHYRYGPALGVLVVLLLFGVLVQGVLLPTIAANADAKYALSDSANYDNVEQPTSPMRSGSPASLVAWDTLGREGRRLVGTGPSQAQLADFWGSTEVKEPIRIYIGIKSANSLPDRADLALQELIRTNAFERRLLLLVTTTGTGWADSSALDTLEYVHGGDTAIVLFQYSYLPSIFATIADSTAGTKTSLAMFHKIHSYWRELDENTRPKFYLHGMSWGAYGSQDIMSSVDLFNAPINGALWAGPPYDSAVWQRITQNRDEGSPIWLPSYQGGATIRFTNQGAGLQDSPADWQGNRYIFLQQADDPVVLFTHDSLYREPEWLQAKSRSPGVAPEMSWYPIATFWQLIFDVVLGTGDALPLQNGHGHRYHAKAYIDCWVALTQPANWNSQQTEALKTLFATMGNPNEP